uniref:small monomeric GTPase n=1 Tax=Hucho hucho TaxID=62062 RepID=A0A4W5MMB9_9TELE
MWGDLKRAVHARNPSNMTELKQYCKEEWGGNPPSRYKRLINNALLIEEKIKWGDGFVMCLCFLVNHIHTSSGTRKCSPEPPPIVIVANKKDLEFDRMVSTEDGEGLSGGLKLSFHEILVRDGWEETVGVFSVLHGDVIQQLDTSPASFRRRAVSKLMQKIPTNSNPPAPLAAASASAHSGTSCLTEPDGLGL